MLIKFCSRSIDGHPWNFHFLCMALCPSTLSCAIYSEHISFCHLHHLGHWINLSGVYGAQFAFNNNKVNYDTAKQSCKNMGGILYEPRDQSVMKSVISLAKKANLGEFWIGIHDMDNEGTFVYESDKSKLSFTNWNSGEPNNWGSGEDCAAVDGSGNWNDLPCADFQRSYICIKKTGKGIFQPRHHRCQ